MKRFENLPFHPADILIPRDCDLSLWSVVACDQYTSQPEYWQRVEERVGKNPSALRLILPESCLEGPDVETDIMAINNTMTRYQRENRFELLPGSILYVERDAIADTLPEGKHFIAEMVGCEVRNADDESIVYGKLTDVFNRGANNVWEIRNGDKEYLMPDIPGIVVSVDIEKEVALVRPIPGIFDDAEEVR